MSDELEEFSGRPLIETIKMDMEKDDPGFRASLAAIVNSPKTRDQILCLGLFRVMEPWPEWVLRIASELLKVYFPRIERDKIFQFLKDTHRTVFETNFENALAGFSLDFLDSKEFSWALGHFQKHIDCFLETFERTKSTFPQRLRDSEPELRKNHASIQGLVLQFLESKAPLEYFKTMQVMIEANQLTYDSEGRLRETTATPIYSAIFFHWVKVESFSGATELCNFLDPILGNVDAEAKLDRVKKIVQRMGITFRPIVSRDELQGDHVPTLL